MLLHWNKKQTVKKITSLWNEIKINSDEIVREKKPFFKVNYFNRVGTNCWQIKSTFLHNINKNILYCFSVVEKSIRIQIVLSKNNEFKEIYLPKKAHGKV